MAAATVLDPSGQQLAVPYPDAATTSRPTSSIQVQYQQFNRDHARLRAPGERAFAQLKSWRILRWARCSTRRIGTIVQATHTLLSCNYPR
ncbi:transposase family protein [Streptomyces sp. NPDC057325]|uniref:transposase family protein n=1 Tax=unclassified Streptomyces TaxID=2593676 RepID=UPI0036277FF0